MPFSLIVQQCSGMVIAGCLASRPENPKRPVHPEAMELLEASRAAKRKMEHPPSPSGEQKPYVFTGNNVAKQSDVPNLGCRVEQRIDGLDG